MEVVFPSFLWECLAWSRVHLDLQSPPWLPCSSPWQQRCFKHWELILCQFFPFHKKPEVSSWRFLEERAIEKGSQCSWSSAGSIWNLRGWNGAAGKDFWGIFPDCVLDMDPSRLLWNRGEFTQAELSICHREIQSPFKFSHANSVSC